jgi:peptidoglycan/xylan/chitin deacetylase (PgdA/CDA1 family)
MRLPAVALCCLLGAGCASRPLETPPDAALLTQPVRFLLTFDDGPSLWQPYNPTTAILDQLASNEIQPGIKAVFFVQTRNRDGGGTPQGRALLHRIHEAGHLLGLHSGSVRGHSNHRRMDTPALERSLADGITDISAIAGMPPALLRPPFWAYDERTLAAYRRAGLNMLLTDISARDGKIYGWIASVRRREHFRAKLAEVRDSVREHKLPVVQGVVPVIVAFHDTNIFTARHMAEYLAILVQESARVGLPLVAMPFYDSTAELAQAAQRRAQHAVYGVAD